MDRISIWPHIVLILDIRPYISSIKNILVGSILNLSFGCIPDICFTHPVGQISRQVYPAGYLIKMAEYPAMIDNYR